ncbi:MAG TPA: hypothetical protein VMK12_21455 [Anaeromyxobacteraceae bacterium]|nr:hypothetical protein [Anaeromyxobacteraceae bacterium]
MSNIRPFFNSAIQSLRQLLCGAAAFGFAALAVLAAFHGPAGDAASRAAFFAVVSVGALLLGRRENVSLDLLAATFLPALFALAVDPLAKPWQVPTAFRDLLHLTPIGAALATALYLAMVLGLLWRGRPLPLRGHVLLFALPFAFNVILLLAAPALLATLGHQLVPGGREDAAQLAGRLLVLATVNELLVCGAGFAMDRRVVKPAAIHVLAILAAVLAGLSPSMAHLAAQRSLLALPPFLRLSSQVLCAAGAQAPLWAETFLVTGVFLDGLRERRPTWPAARTHFSTGFAQGAVYGGLFILIVQCAAIVAHSRVPLLLRAQPLVMGAVLGAPLFPLAKTVLESFDGSAPLLSRLRLALFEPRSYLRGALSGGGLAVALDAGLPGFSSATRFACGVAIGAIGYSLCDVLADGLVILSGRRSRMQSWRTYALGACLGGFVGGALAWYFDAVQLAAVIRKVSAYATLSYSAEGRAVSSYVIYPLFSKWGEMHLGATDGGVALLYAESLSGVVNWSLAAPLFSLNLIMLGAIFQRSLSPLRVLFSAEGAAALVDQAVRVLRWGLWMAPIIYSFLRLAPEPSFYNQDGAVRTAVTMVEGLVLSPSGFRAFSLGVFLGLLAYDWLRILIWFDHMGLRVATLVNLSFVGGDLLDERAARFVGHSARTRCIPEGIRRFATWAPLLIPFYLPRGADWDYLWTHAPALHDSAGPVIAPVALLLLGYRLAAFSIAIPLGAALARAVVRPAPSLAASPRGTLVLANGLYRLELWPDGRAYGRAASQVRFGRELDLTRRPTDPLDLTGKFFYLREIDGRGDPLGPPWSLARQPVGEPAERVGPVKSSPSEILFSASRDGLRATARVRLPLVEAVELWRIRLENLEPRRRQVELVSYEEVAFSPVDDYRRTPFFAAMHVGTCFVRSLGAIFARNRLLPDREKDQKRRRISREVSFHAARADEEGGVRLAGYEDSRAHFLGAGTARAPDILREGDFRDPEDEGLLYTFDPAASLRLLVDLPAEGVTEVRLIGGYAPDERHAASLICHHLGLPLPSPDEIESVFMRTRLSHQPRARHIARFSPDGTELKVSSDLPRPYVHLLANELGHGAMISSCGESFSFAGNAQKNALSAFHLDGVPAQLPSQAIYLRDLDTGEADSLGYVPCRKAESTGLLTFGRGYASMQKAMGELELTLDIWVPPEEPAEVRLLRIRNSGSRPVRLRLVSFVEIVLAELPEDSRGRIETRYEKEAGVLLFQNRYNDFRKGWAFVATNLQGATCEWVRTRFVGTDGDLREPFLLLHGVSDATAVDDGRRVAAFCGEVQVPAGGEAEVAQVLGQVETVTMARSLAAKARLPSVARVSLTKTRSFWDETLSALRIETNRPDFDRLVNDWLPYQVLTSRLFGRAGPQQRSGAYGYRDQLQDVLPLLFIWPQLARRQILLHSAQQFLEGDVLKWWHPSWEGRTGIGARSRASDPHLWLPYVVARYVEATGDRALLLESVPFLEGPPVPRGAESGLVAPRPSRERASVYEHCRRAIERSLAQRGAHGLPLLGTGDWNDGLDVIGAKGRGESVWLGFFLHGVLRDFAPLASHVRDDVTARRMGEEAGLLREALSRMRRGVDYCRAVSDEGEELRIDSALMGAFPLLSGAVGASEGLAALESALCAIEREDRVLLLWPPFTESSLPFPGRIALYPPGVRENGGQYSHGASWCVDAYLAAAENAKEAGDAALVERCRARAAELWFKLGPIGREEKKGIAYGLPPHQQPADIYDGPGYQGRGGWSHYTGAAARMLSCAYALLGLGMRDGKLVLADDIREPRGGLELLRLWHRGRLVELRDRDRTVL